MSRDRWSLRQVRRSADEEETMPTRTPFLAGLMTAGLLALPGSALAADRDHDRLPDGWEKKHGLSVTHHSAAADPDRDGLTNLGEFLSKTSPKRADSDRDRVEDADEDRDRDRVDNGNEVLERTHPDKRDTDGDRQPDGVEDADRDRLSNAAEDATGSNPVDGDTDDDGRRDGEEGAGKVLAFDGTTLVIDLANGATLSGRVDTEATEVECKTEDEHERDHEARHARAATDFHDDDEGDKRAEDEDEDEDEEASGRSSENEDDEASGRSDEGDEDDLCVPTDLRPGVLVHEAEIEAGVFEEVKIIK